MKKKISSLFLLFSAICGSFPVEALVTDPSPCLRELELHFFDPTLVNQALSMYNVPQGTWATILQSLQERSASVPERLKSKTAGMYPNPIAYPLQKGPTAKLLKDTLYEVFVEALAQNGVHEQPTVGLMFDFIFSRQMPSLIQCFGPEVLEIAPQFQ